MPDFDPLNTLPPEDVLLLALDKVTQQWAKKANEILEDVVEALSEHGAYEETLRENESENTVVTCELLMKAIHILTVRIAFRSFPEVWKAYINEGVINVAAEMVESYLFKKSVGSPFGLAELLSIWAAAEDEERVMRSLEHEIRLVARSVREELNELVRKRPRKENRPVEKVHTRHKKEGYK